MLAHYWQNIHWGKMNYCRYLALIFLSAFILRISPCDSAHERQHSPEDTIWLDFENPAAIITDRTENASYFGASVAMHRSSSGEGWLFIGAPNANDGASNPGISNPGKVWRCNLERGTSSALSGITGTMCPHRSPSGWARTDRWSCNRMFLGASVVSSRDKLITCAPRWGRLTDWNGRVAQGTEGACYWFQLENVTRTFHPLQYSAKQLLIPIADQNFVNGDTRLDPGRFTRWEQGQFGFSARVSKFRDQLVTGAAGVFRFDGGVILPPSTLQPTDNPKWTMFSTELLTHQAYTKSESLCNPPIAVNFWIRLVHSGYLGYSVTSGRYFSEYEEMVAAGAPRSSGGRPCGALLGSVLIMSYASAAPSQKVRPKADTHREHRWKPYVTVGGGGLGSYFGSAMESVDINNDGKDDLIVGAPLECGAERGETDRACTGNEDTGCVYIYSQLWEPARYGAMWKHSQRICSDVPWGRFGSTVARLGDVDQDGFHDFAVGAPAEGGSGAVYVFFGGRSNKQLHRMRISGGYRSGSGTTTSGFGQSIIGDVDLDGNGTPDFAVGSHVNQTVSLFRTHPKLNVTSSLEFFRNGSPERTTTLAQTDTQFRIKYCLSVSLLPTGLSRQKVLTLWNRLVVDESQNRFRLQHANPFALAFQPGERIKCIEFDAVRTQPITDAEDFPDITFSAHSWFTAPNATELTPVTRRGLDSKSELLFSRQDISGFCTECPYSMNRTFSDLPALAFAIDCMKRGDSLKLPVCKPVFTIQMRHSPEPSSATRDPLVLGHVSNVLVTVTVGNTNQTAFRPAMKFSWKLIPPTDGSSKMQETMTSPLLVETAQVQPCSTSPSNDQATSRPQEVCQLVRKVLRKDGQETLTYSLRMSNVVALRRSRAPTKLQLGAQVFLENDAEFKPAKQSLTVNVIAADANVTVGSPPIIERLPLLSAMSSKRTLDAKFQVKLGGQSPVRVKLFVGLPASLPSVKSQKLFDIHRPDGDCSVKSECWVCQPENGPMKNRAGRRALETLVRNVSANASTKCLSTRNPACEYFSCEKDIFLYRNILVDFHLDVSAESEKRIGELMPTTGFRLYGFAFVYIFDDRDGATASDHSACLFELNLLPPEQNEIKAWIVVVAAASGLLILSCVIFGLCKCGFFKREKKELLLAHQQGGAESEEVSYQHSAVGSDQTTEEAF